ncbi:MAG: DUF2306 domain-containing protein [Pseudorhodobacter sp.]|nr:DUF2306 domain-containing protein [Pseudorhodobacter sp.]
MTRPGVRRFLLPAALLLLAFVPSLVALMRVVQVPMGTLPDDKLYLASTPISLFLHALCGATFALVAPLQLFPSLRRRFPKLHRHAGWVLVLAGLTIAVTGLAMVALHPFSATLPLRATRLVVGSSVIASLTLAIRAIRQRDIAEHSAWMLRTYALIMGAGTQAVIGLPIFILYGQPAPEVMDLILAVCWPINLVVAELVIRRGQQPRHSRQPAGIAG